MRQRLLFLPFFSLLISASAVCQVGTRPSDGIPGAQTQSPTVPRFPGDPQEPPDPFHDHLRQRTRELERQKRIVDDANRLVKLTAQYRSDVEHHGAVTVDDQKLLLQIEKLAREVKDRMRGM